jgi:magnesium chelatase subunit D
VSGAREAAFQLWADALRAAALTAVDPHGLGGVALRAQHGPVRERWLSALHALLPAGTPVRRVPLHARDDRLLGGLDLTATLAAGRPVAQTGLMAEADGGVLVLAMAERIADATAARVCAALDSGEVALARDGLQSVSPARFGVVALDERAGDDEGPPARLLERLAFHLDLAAVSMGEVDALAGGQAPAGSPRPVTGREAGAGRVRGLVSAAESESDAAAAARAPASTAAPAAAAAAPASAETSASAAAAPPDTDPDPDPIAQARALLPRVAVADDVLEALCGTALALGIASLRAPLLALRAARAAAALDGRDTVSTEDAALAARLVLAPRATVVPAPPPDPQADEPPPPEPPEPREPDDPGASDAPDTDPADPPPELPADRPLDDVVLEAARAAIPAGLLASLALAEAAAARAAAGGRMGATREARLRGRPAGTRPGLPRDGARLALVDTLRAAAPWQRLRKADSLTAGTHSRIALRASDFRVARLQERTETTTVFAIDASGSAALHRLAEAKGAVELLLADCYVRRDRVAVLAFRGRSAELLLPPTRSLVRAKRSLAGLPGGGGTPLAAGIDAAAALADATRRRGGTPVVVLLTDGRANVARDGAGGRARADADAREAAHRLRAAGHTALLIDTSPQPQPPARELAAAMGAAYLPLPHADATAMSRSVQAAAASARAPARGR